MKDPDEAHMEWRPRLSFVARLAWPYIPSNICMQARGTWFDVADPAPNAVQNLPLIANNRTQNVAELSPISD